MNCESPISKVPGKRSDCRRICEVLRIAFSAIFMLK